MTKNKVKFCWLCGKKLYGNHQSFLTIDGHSRTLHKACDKEIRTQKDFCKNKDGQYQSIMWDLKGFTRY